MRFFLYRIKSNISRCLDSCALVQSTWDDNNYKTTFTLIYISNTGQIFDLGSVQIGFKGMQPTSVINFLGEEFSELHEDFFSLGASEEYYERLLLLEESIREQILISLKDLAFNLEDFDKYRAEKVLVTSLLRGKTEFTVRNQFHRMSIGGAKLTPYRFSYISGFQDAENDLVPVELKFVVTPEVLPPSNIHILIGRNGAGKTRMIQNMMRALQTNDKNYGYFYQDEENTEEDRPFANVVCVAFSPFDNYSKVLDCSKGSLIPFSYIGLDRKSSDLLGTIQDQFCVYFSNCMQSISKRLRWKTTMHILRTDPAFEESHVVEFDKIWETDNSKTKKSARDTIGDLFSELSSGHKVTLLIITACVDKIEEKSIIFLDEPENHLHPPLLSSFARALSYLSIERNGVTVISTHSPVLLQEVPRQCVWIIHRTNTIIKAERPSIETFGTSISSLTSEIFGLEVTESGFHKFIRDVVEQVENPDFQALSDKFQNQLGNEAQALLRTMIAQSKKMI